MGVDLQHFGSPIPSCLYISIFSWGQLKEETGEICRYLKQPWNLGWEGSTLPFKFDRRQSFGIFPLSLLYSSFIWHSFKYKTNQIYLFIQPQISVYPCEIMCLVFVFFFINFFIQVIVKEEIWTAMNYLKYKPFAIWARLYILFVNICFITWTASSLLFKK